ncbi:hypothetical protein R3P38DRAFT_2614819 [Favolaschia claudopus]|uniref:F-box domain-containing protein n=1 Tax=Favolaschia claudopus TaxID=2862362 RepID=A0AAW0CGB5_9AGAR
MLDRLPPEICDHIFDFACRDTGYTGCSLSLVSKYIQQAAAPTRYLSVALMNRAQILAFAPLVEHSEALFHTRYLYLKGLEDEEAMQRIEHAAYAGATKASGEYRELRKQLSAEDEKVDEAKVDEAKAASDRYAKAAAEMVEFGKEGARAIETVLRHLASNLEVLDISFNEHVAKQMVNTLSLPLLRDLTTRGGFPMYPNADVGQDFPILGATNSLRHLHIVETFDQWNATDAFTQNGISYFAPCLTHLRFSELRNNTGTDETTIEYLEKSLGWVGTVHRKGITLLPSTLQLVIMKPTVEPPPHKGCFCTDDTPEYYEMVKVARRLRDRDHRVVLLNADPEDSTEDVYFQEWKEKVNGMPCRWDTSDADMTPSE